MKNIKPWMWVVLVIIIVGLIVWAVVANNKSKQSALQQAAINNGINQPNQLTTSTLAQVLNSLFPFYSAYQSGNNSNNYVPGGANSDATGTPLGDYCDQYPDSALCRG